MHLYKKNYLSNFIQCEELWTSPTEEEEPTFKLFIYKDTNLIELEKVSLRSKQ